MLYVRGYSIIVFSISPGSPNYLLTNAYLRAIVIAKIECYDVFPGIAARPPDSEPNKNANLLVSSYIYETNLLR